MAIEPFSTCVQLLRQTCELNAIDQVIVCAGAASDRNGEAKLALHVASELNEIVTEETSEYPTESIACFTLDSLIDTHQLQRVDWLKIDAERHEMQVLRGSDRLLQQFQPAILYENVVSQGESNLPVADYLRSIGYPFLIDRDEIPLFGATFGLRSNRGKLSKVRKNHEITLPQFGASGRSIASACECNLPHFDGVDG